MAPRLLIGSVRRKYSLPLLGCPLPSRFVPVRFHLQDDTGVHAIDHRLHFWPAVALRAREDHLWSGSQLNRIILGWDTRVRVRVLVLGLRYKVLGYLLGEGAPLLPQHVGYLEGALARILHELWRALRDVDHLQPDMCSEGCSAWRHSYRVCGREKAYRRHRAAPRCSLWRRWEQAGCLPC